jgi:hypothetical protein
MLGRSSRFFNQGYDQPKYKLYAGGKTVFELVVCSFEKYFDSETFVFVLRQEFKDEEFISSTLIRLGVKNFTVLNSDHDTRGQAESVYLSLNDTKREEELYIFNIDTILFNFSKSVFAGSVGYLEVFKGVGEHWSFVLPSSEDNIAKRVVEKKRVSNLCSNGLYQFSSVNMFRAAYEKYLNNFWDGKTELYVAPLYDALISEGYTVSYKVVDIGCIGFCGTPEEYLEICERLEVGGD